MVISDRVGAKDVVVDGETGFVVPARDPAALSERLCRLYESRDEARRMGERAACRAEELELGRIKQRIADMCRRVVGAPAGRMRCKQEAEVASHE